MEADDYGTTRADAADYMQCIWGDLIVGTKEQLQAYGLGLGRAFPGERGCPQTLLEVFDSRGYSVLITKHHRAGKYSASIYFPHWPKKHTEKELLPFSPGVSKREYTWGDVFIGSAESLIEAGIIKRENLPGQPGMRKMRVTLRPDGTAKTSARRDDQPGTRIIERASGSTYAVSLLVSEAESDRRKSEERAADEQWRRKIHSLRRPAMLRPLVATAIAELKSAIAAAARDEHFQGWLLRIISEPIPGSSSKPRTT